MKTGAKKASLWFSPGTFIARRTRSWMFTGPAGHKFQSGTRLVWSDIVDVVITINADDATQHQLRLRWTTAVLTQLPPRGCLQYLPSQWIPVMILRHMQKQFDVHVSRRGVPGTYRWFRPGGVYEKGASAAANCTVSHQINVSNNKAQNDASAGDRYTLCVPVCSAHHTEKPPSTRNQITKPSIAGKRNSKQFQGEWSVRGQD